jgi:hypothetical protein
MWLPLMSGTSKQTYIQELLNPVSCDVVLLQTDKRTIHITDIYIYLIHVNELLTGKQ